MGSWYSYIHTQKDGRTYLASILDLHTQKIVGYSFSKTMDTSLVLRALDNAITTQKPGKGLIIHSDRGSQYTAKEYRKAVESKEFRLSYSAKGCPYDNACLESFHVYDILKVVLPHNWLLHEYHQRYIIYSGDVYEI